MISKNELQNIISGAGGGSKSSFIAAAASFLRAGKEAGEKTKEFGQSKVEKT